jgi:anti-sigma regulatory factor (Ser/Thr protein kinase)
MSRRADAVYGSYPPTYDLEHGSGVGPAHVADTAYWPLQSHLELGAFPSAVPSARLHARFVVAEWGLGSIADTVELIVSELITNGIKASEGLEGISVIRLGLSSDERQVLVTVWDGNQAPMNASIIRTGGLPDPGTEGGRGLFLVDSLSTAWGVHWPENTTGKVVWAVIAAEKDIANTVKSRRIRTSLPKRVPYRYQLRRPAETMHDLAVLQRVREGLRGLE